MFHLKTVPLNPFLFPYLLSDKNHCIERNSLLVFVDSRSLWPSLISFWITEKIEDWSSDTEQLLLLFVLLSHLVWMLQKVVFTKISCNYEFSFLSTLYKRTLKLKFVFLEFSFFHELRKIMRPQPFETD